MCASLGSLRDIYMSGQWVDQITQVIPTQAQGLMEYDRFAKHHNCLYRCDAFAYDYGEYKYCFHVK